MYSSPQYVLRGYMFPLRSDGFTYSLHQLPCCWFDGQNTRWYCLQQHSCLSVNVGWGILEGKKSDASDADKCLAKGMMCCAFSHKSRSFQSGHYILTFIALYR